jgi:adenine-specific DNA-methyltransferase
LELIAPTDPLSHSTDLTAENIERLRELFPQAVTEDGGGKRIDFDVLRELLGDELATGEEKYGLNWHGKRAARRLALTPSTGTLRPAPEDSVDWDTTQNLMIEGDNLEVLKLLQKSYAGKIKMIYIDPPYNTGNDFVYKDDFRDSIGNYQRITGQRDAEGAKLTTNADASGRFHTDWLNMMYPRLILARALLKEDGAIFISIDDAEITNLRELCASVFGEENFLGVFVRRRRLATGMRDSTISPDHEYIVSFARDVAKIVLYGFERKESDFPFSDADGRYRSTDLTVGMTKEMRPNQFYALKHPDTGSEYWPPDTRVWRFEPSTMATHVVKKNIIWPDDSPQSKMSRPRFKTRFETPDGVTKTNPVSTWIDTRVVNPDDGDGTISLSAGLNQEATKEVRELFGDQIFDYPKPLSLVGGLISYSDWAR